MTDHNRFITIEGGEGTGKSTLISALKQKFSASGQQLIVTREPGGTALAEDLRGVLLDGSDRHGDVSAMSEALILSAARCDHVDQLISPALADGKWVICDRFVDSTRAYQGGILSRDQVDSLEQLATRGVMPSLTILLDAAPEALMERRQQRGESLDRFESRGLDFHKSVREAFLKISDEFSERFIVLDAMMTANDLASEAWKKILMRYPDQLAAARSEGVS